MTMLALKKPCSRCPRIVETEIDLAEVVRMAQEGGIDANSPKALYVEIDGVVVAEHANLCGPCRAIVTRYLGQIAKQLIHQSSERGGDEVGDEK